MTYHGNANRARTTSQIEKGSSCSSAEAMARRDDRRISGGAGGETHYEAGLAAGLVYVEKSEGIAAVDVPGRAGDEPCLGPRQECHGIGDVAGLAVVADRRRRPHGVGELSGVGIRVGGHRPRLDGVDGDPTGPEFAGEIGRASCRERV